MFLGHRIFYLSLAIFLRILWNLDLAREVSEMPYACCDHLCVFASLKPVSSLSTRWYNETQQKTRRDVADEMRLDGDGMILKGTRQSRVYFIILQS